MVETYSTLYQYDENGSLRVWWMERYNNTYRTVSGLRDGAKVVSGWKEAKPKNVGRSNATTAEEQAKAEIASLYEKRLKRGYYDHIPDPNQESKFFEPMLAQKYKDFHKKKKQFIFPIYVQPKLDGIRCIINFKGMWSRNGEQIVSSPHIFNTLKPIFKEFPELTLDGELYNHIYKNDFNSIVSLVKSTVNFDFEKTAKLVEYHTYDVHFGSKSKHLTFNTRTNVLTKLINLTKPNKVVIVPTHLCHSYEEIDSFYATFLEDSYEGLMVRFNTPYENGKRTWNLLKRKEFEDDEFIVLDIQEGQGNWAGMAKRVILQLKTGESCKSGIRGNQAYLQQVLIEKDKYIGKPAKTRFQGYTPDGKLRFPVVIELDRTM